ncbi:MAG: endonuclease domain-containing protein [Pseudonocardiaceae bacterium]
MKLREPAPVFKGTDAVLAGTLTRSQLRGPAVRRLFQGVYAFRDEPMTHELRCAAAALALPPETVITGRSAAALWGVQLVHARDCVHVAVPGSTRIARRAGLDVRRTLVRPDESTPWSEVAVATPLRTTLDLLLDQPLPEAVADLDAVLRHGLVTLPQITALVEGRSDKGIVRARRAIELADPRAESRPESRVRVWLVLDGLRPEPQYWIEDSHGRLARADLAFPEHKVAVEYDGSWRDGELWALNRDRDRLNRVQAAGWEIVFVTAQLLHDPARMVSTVRAALDRRRR